MHFYPKIFSLALFVLALGTVSTAAPRTAPGRDETAAVGAQNSPAMYTVSHEEMVRWLATTNAELTFIGEPMNPLAPRAAPFTVVTYCTTVEDNDICGGECRVYVGGSACIDAPGTQCISATRDIGHCSGSDCSGTCNQLSTCRTPLANGFCFTPATRSFLVGL